MHCTRLLKNTSLTNLIELKLNWKPDRHNSTVPLKYVNSGLLIKRDISSQRHSLCCFVKAPSPCRLLKQPIVCRRFCKHRVHLHSVTQGPYTRKDKAWNEVNLHQIDCKASISTGWLHKTSINCSRWITWRAVTGVGGYAET